MKVSRQIGTVTIEAEGDSPADVFGELAKLQEVFEHEKCGCCGSEDYRYVVREAKKGNKTYNYYELHCQNHEGKCRARLAFGQSDDGVIYPKRRWGQLSPLEQEQRKGQKPKDDDKYGALPDEGWFKYIAPK